MNNEFAGVIIHQLGFFAIEEGFPIGCQEDGFEYRSFSRAVGAVDKVPVFVEGDFMVDQIPEVVKF
jgi:hypothetical protein